jgi:hypothetical protein
VTLEKRFVDRHILDADDAPVRFEFQDAIYKQKRIAMRQERLDLGLFHYGHREPSK